MFGINFSEIILICIVSLIVLGPKQLPQIASRLGLIIYSIRSYIANFKKELYYSSGAHEFVNVKQDLIKAYSSIRSNVTPHNKVEEPELNFTQLNQYYQPELEFDRQPELFDIIELPQ